MFYFLFSFQISYFFGGLLSLAGCLWVGLGVGSEGEVYGVAVVMGKSRSNLTVLNGLQPLNMRAVVND